MNAISRFKDTNGILS